MYRILLLFPFLLTCFQASAQGVVINELLASNDATQADQDGEFDDWIELYNTGNTAIDLSGYTLSDDPDDPFKWPFPAGSSIGAGEYVIVWADDDQQQAGFHTQFKLSADGESVILSDPSGTEVDRVDFGPQATDISFGRFPNGTGDFRVMPPTFAAANSDVVAVRDLPAAHVDLFPLPASDHLTVVLHGLPVVRYELVDVSGRVVLGQAIARAERFQIELSPLPAGTYGLRLIGSDGIYSRLLVVE